MFAEDEQRQQAELNDTDIEFQGCIAQILALLETMWSLYLAKPGGGAAENLASDTLLYLLVSFCHMGKSVEQLYSQDQNAFMVMFRNTEEEPVTSIDIRLSVVEFFENCVIPHRNTDITHVQQMLESVYTG